MTAAAARERREARRRRVGLGYSRDVEVERMPVPAGVDGYRLGRRVVA